MMSRWFHFSCENNQSLGINKALLEKLVEIKLLNDIKKKYYFRCVHFVINV